MMKANRQNGAVAKNIIYSVYKILMVTVFANIANSPGGLHYQTFYNCNQYCNAVS